MTEDIDRDGVFLALKHFGITHVFIASYVRACAEMPGLMRFLSGQKAYQRMGIILKMAVKKELKLNSPETIISVELDPHDNADDVYTYPGDVYSSGTEDATIVATHLTLAAYNAGVDSCWLNRFDPDRLAKDLNLPENEKIVMLLDLGYAAEGAVPLPNHGNRKPLEETVSYI